MEINKYPDGSSYVIVENTGRDYITVKINSYEDLWHLNQYVDAYNHAFNIKPNILITNLIDAQADRRFNPNESSGLKLVCKFLNNLDAGFRIFHPHNPEIVEALIDNVEIIDNSEFINNVLLCLIAEEVVNNKEGDIDNNLILMSSDAGGFKPLMKLCDKIQWQGETESASKSRQYIKNEQRAISKPINTITPVSYSKLTQRINRQDFEGKDILIIDDICVYGGTFKGLSKLLKDRNCGKLYLAVSHMTVQNLGVDSVTDYFDKVFTTNSKFDNYYTGKVLSQPNNLEIIKIF